MSSSLTSLLALPLLCLISIPLIFSAWLTLSVALFTLLLRASVVYLEVGYALVINFFTLPTSTSTSSFLPFAPSEPPTPAAGNSRRNSASAQAQSLIQPRRTNTTLSSWTFSAPQDNRNRDHDRDHETDRSRRKSKKTYAQSMIRAHDLPTAPLPVNFTGLPVSGDKRRDFEGVGGWRSYPDALSRVSKPRSTQQEKPLSSSSSSTHSLVADVGVGAGAGVNIDADIDADERAWLSLNHRLELPSRVVLLGTGSTAPSNVPSPALAHGEAAANVFVPAFPSDVYTQPGRDRDQSARRHHHRSHTTSTLTTADLRTGGGLAISLSTRPDQSSRPVSPSSVRHAPFMTPQPYSVVQTRSMRPLTTSNEPHTTGHGLGGGGLSSGGYFALPRPGGLPVPSFSAVVSPSSSGQTTPGAEDHGSPSQLTRFIAHYPTGVRHRRRSISGPHARRVSIGERLA
ncbi:hypothetical protein N7466_003874 [Penicillium verhagenii]|uniref:uncharacterized protein n=1 Tax=Penicillium verhagenii TaxID=1562060 RepID=UPI0025459CE6|nr:uncharacterized protein N7466_003874 [Penicillium verhagenii]KAJ5934327.1 hypothetical protein N7466_003874 [Penicillium verhagenii]